VVLRKIIDSGHNCSRDNVIIPAESILNLQDLNRMNHIFSSGPNLTILGAKAIGMFSRG